MRVNLTERLAKAATTEGRGLQVRDNGRKTFTLDYTFEGRRRRYLIGDYPDWSVVAARDEAKRLKRYVDAGRDPPEPLAGGCSRLRWSMCDSNSKPSASCQVPECVRLFQLNRREAS